MHKRNEKKKGKKEKKEKKRKPAQIKFFQFLSRRISCLFVLEGSLFEGIHSGFKIAGKLSKITEALSWMQQKTKYLSDRGKWEYLNCL